MSNSKITVLDVSSPSAAVGVPASPTDSKTPKLPKLPSASKNTRRRSSKVAEMQKYLKELEISHANTRSLVAEIKGPPKRDFKATPTRSRRRSTHNYDNAPESPTQKKVSPSHKMWVESLERMRDKPKRVIEKPEGVKHDEHHRLAKRLATLDFPLDACIEALDKSDMNIEKSVNLLLKWYPKGEGGRSAVQKLLKVLIGAERKLESMRGKLNDLYHPERGMGSPSTAARTIFSQFDTDQSGFIDASEFRSMLNGIGVSMSEEEFQEALRMLDEDGNGTIETEEFIHWWQTQTGVKFKDMPLDSVFSHVENEGKKLLNAERIKLFIYDMPTSQLWTRRSVGSSLYVVPPGHSLAHTVVLTGKVLNIADAKADKRVSESKYPDAKSILLAPIIQHGKSQDVIGVIEVVNKLWGTPFSEPDAARLRKFCSQTKVGVEKCLVQLRNCSPVRPPKTLAALGSAGYSSPQRDADDRRNRAVTFNVSQLGFPNFGKKQILPSTMAKIQGLLDEYDEENDVTSPLKSDVKKKLEKKLSMVLEGEDEIDTVNITNSREDTQNWMSRLRQIENQG